MATETSLARGFANLMNRVKRVTDVRARDFLAAEFIREAKEIILARTIAGKGVDRDGGSARSLKRLSPNYIKYRQANSKLLASYTRPTKSNLTFSGELLSSLIEKRNKPGNWQLVFRGTHGSGITNARLAKYVSRDRPFMFLARSEIDRLQKSYKRNFATLVKRSF